MALRLARSLALSTAALFLLVPVAHADISGVVRNPAGIPIPGASVEARDADGQFADSDTTDAEGRYVIESSSLSGDTPPYTLTAEKFDQCSSSGGSQQQAAPAPVNDGAAQDFQLAVFDFCAGFTFSGPEHSGLVDPVARQTLVPPGGAFYLRVLAASDATNLQVVLSDGTTVIGSSPSDDTVGSFAPAGGYEGPLTLRYTSEGRTVERNLGTLVARPVPVPTPQSGPIDLAAIVDVSGSMGGNDPNFLRKDAVSLLVDLARPGDRLGAFGFDDDFNEIFGMTPIGRSAAGRNALKRLADQRIVNEGGTNYNVGFAKAYEGLVGPGIDPNTQKGAIFLTDGGHNSGQYENLHLRFAYTPTGRPWPVCAIQLGQASSFAPEDVARLKRIAAETGGQYFATSSSADLTDLYLRCFGLTSGERTLAKRTFTFRQGQTKNLTKRIARGTQRATFFLGWGAGTYSVKLIDPRGRAHTSRRPGRGVTFRKGDTYAVFQVRRPRAGRWKMQMQARRIPTPTDRANARVTAPPRTRR